VRLVLEGAQQGLPGRSGSLSAILMNIRRFWSWGVPGRSLAARTSIFGLPMTTFL
jgi:hypothetical protein